MDSAEADPGKFLDAYSNPQRKLNEMLSVAIYEGYVKEDAERGYFYGSTFMGFSKPEILVLLEKDDVILARLRSKLIEAGIIKGRIKDDKTDDEKKIDDET